MISKQQANIAPLAIKLFWGRAVLLGVIAFSSFWWVPFLIRTTGSIGVGIALVALFLFQHWSGKYIAYLMDEDSQGATVKEK